MGKEGRYRESGWALAVGEVNNHPGKEYHVPAQHRLPVRPVIRPIQSLAAQLED